MSGGPQFLVIGAQKCGTTTLYEDLRSHPGIFLPDKESSGLLDPGLPGPEAVAKYAALFARAGDRLPGEVSTRYAMRPAVDVTSLARRLLGDTRIVYIVREPISRVISHHHHLYALRLAAPDIDAAVRDHPELVDNSRYAMQIEPWIDAFGPERVHIMKFEDFIADRRAEGDRVIRFLGLDRSPLPAGAAVHNAANEKVVAVGAWGRLSRSRLYRQRVRPLLPERARRGLMGAVLPRAVPRPAGPSRATITRLVNELRPEVDRLGELTGEGPWWDLNALPDRYDSVLATDRTSIDRA